VTDEFMKAALETGGTWETRMRTTGEVVRHLDAKDLWRQVAEAAWGCADPGVQYDSTINRWHTCPNTAASTRRTRAPSTCSSTTRPATSRADQPHEVPARRRRQRFDVDGYRHACRVFFVAQEILVDLSSYPTKQIAKNSHDYRPLGLGYANLGTMLMQMGIPYDSTRAARSRPRITAIMCGQAYATSAAMAGTKGPFNGFAKNREPMLRVMGMHRDAAYRSTASTARRRSTARRARTGTRPSRSARSTATATRRPPCSRPRAPSASSWTATPPASSPTSPS
jgi:ribonucleoside-diphosphate reductase alpha chain